MLLKNKNYKKELQEYKNKTWSVIQRCIDEEVFYLTRDKKCNENDIKMYKSKRLIWNRITFFKNANKEIVNPFRIWKRTKCMLYIFMPLLLPLTLLPINYDIASGNVIYNVTASNLSEYILLFGLICFVMFIYIHGLKYKKRCNKMLADNGIYKPKRYLKKSSK
ncbi:MAG: hypothetical protein LBH55_01590 [Mycoplasmataceae bacterium]|nr:hypothetical protein [Mycoplasmataceae bacterium]